MKKNVFCAGMPLLSPWSRIAAIGSIAMLAACGDNVENVYQTGLEVFSSEKDLPKCSKDNEGDQAFVKDDAVTRICVDGDWVPMSGSMSADFSCKAVELKDKSGVKIVCNGDSIGVVLNGKDGEKGDAGEDGKDGDSGTGCSIADRTDSTVVVQCGDSTMTIDLGVALPNDTAEADSERTPISLDSLVGFTQKGPFLKGATVYLYELSDGRTLKQTNGNFTSNITRDDGRYKFSARDLVSQYAMVVVDGYYRNEVTGVTSNAAIRLKALTDMRKRSSVNVNILTDLEFERVYHLVTRGDKDGKKLTVKKAKRQAQEEIRKQFLVEVDDETDAEDMDVFGSGEADAVLLAISILLQGDRSEADMMALLSQISLDMAEDGVWNDSTAKVKMQIADWAALADAEGRLDQFGENVLGWGLSTTVPDYKKHVRKFYESMLGLGKCGSSEYPAGSMTFIRNAKSVFYAMSFEDTTLSKERFICKADGHWSLATGVEKDTRDWGDTTVGAFKVGILSGLKYIFTKEGWRYYKESYDVINGGFYTAATGARGTQPGAFYYFTDDLVLEDAPSWADKDTSRIDWPATIRSSWYDAFSDIINQCDGLCGDLKLINMDGGYAGFGFLISGPDGKGSLYSADISSWEGLCFTYTSNHPIKVELTYADPATGLGIADIKKGTSEFDYPYMVLPRSGFISTVCTGWDSFKAEESVEDAVTGEEAAKSLTSVRFKYEGRYLGGPFKILGVSKISSAGKTVLNPSYSYPKGCGDLWCGANLDYTVKFDDNGSLGQWYAATDAGSGEGMTMITYPITNGHSNLETVLKEVVDTCRGICGTISFTGFEEYVPPFAVVGITLSDDASKVMDVSSWGGICVAYESQVPMELGLYPSNERQIFFSYDLPRVSLPIASKMVVKDIPWEQFMQYNGWSSSYDRSISGPEVAKELAELIFRFDSESGSKADFKIYGLGRLGTCTP